jgi:hypothetical protein
MRRLSNCPGWFVVELSRIMRGVQLVATFSLGGLEGGGGMFLGSLSKDLMEVFSLMGIVRYSFNSSPYLLLVLRGVLILSDIVLAIASKVTLVGFGVCFPTMVNESFAELDDMVRIGLWMNGYAFKVCVRVCFLYASGGLDQRMLSVFVFGMVGLGWWLDVVWLFCLAVVVVR